MSDFCKHGYIGGCRECIGQMPDGKAIEDALRAERDNFRAVLEGEGYQNLDKIASEKRDCTQIGAAARARTLEIVAERDAFRAEASRLREEIQHIHISEHTENVALRAEVAALKADCRTLETAKADAEALAMSYEGTAERLQAELAKRDEPLTDEQAGDLAQAGDWPITPRGWKIIDAAIRRVRRGE